MWFPLVLQHGSVYQEGRMVGRWIPTDQSITRYWRRHNNQNSGESSSSDDRTRPPEHNKYFSIYIKLMFKDSNRMYRTVEPSSRVVDSETLQTARRVVNVVEGNSPANSGRNSRTSYASSVLNSTYSQRASQEAPPDSRTSFPPPPSTLLSFPTPPPPPSSGAPVPLVRNNLPSARNSRNSMGRGQAPPPTAPPPPDQPVLNWNQHSSAASTVSGVTLRSGKKRLTQHIPTLIRRLLNSMG